jgi:hypothetical protein
MTQKLIIKLLIQIIRNQVRSLNNQSIIISTLDSRPAADMVHKNLEQVEQSTLLLAEAKEFIGEE